MTINNHLIAKFGIATSLLLNLASSAAKLGFFALANFILVVL